MNTGIKVEDHPHCLQLNADYCKDVDKGPQEWKPELRFLNQNKQWPRMSYVRRRDKDRSTNHWGQLKLLESEILVLIENSESTVIYAGAAPGKHLIVLANLFPNVKFELYDPAAFDKTVINFAEASNGRFSIHNQFFDEAVAQQVAERKDDNIIFICDIRTADNRMKPEEFSKALLEDNDRQKKWTITMEPKISLLKFRLPWGEGKTEYLDGKILIQIYPPCTSTETRLWVTVDDLKKSLKIYDHVEYEEQLMYHNTVQRAQLFPHDVKVPGLDFCYDCCGLVNTFKALLKTEDPIVVANAINKLIEDINEKPEGCQDQGRRTLASKYQVSSQRGRNQFARKRFRDAEGKDSFTVEANKKRKY